MPVISVAYQCLALSIHTHTGSVCDVIQVVTVETYLPYIILKNRIIQIWYVKLTHIMLNSLRFESD